MDLSPNNHKFYPALTDAGLCSMYNGQPLRLTYAGSERTDKMEAAFDARKKFEAEKIVGTGKVYEKTFWLNIADR